VEPQREFRVWFVTSPPEGEPISSKDKESLEGDKQYRLIVVDELTAVRIKVNGEPCVPPAPQVYELLVFFLKHQGWGGTSLHIGANQSDLRAHWGFHSLKILLNQIEMEPEMYKYRLDDLSLEVKKVGGKLGEVQGNVRKRVNDLRVYLGKTGLKVNLKAQKGLQQFCWVGVPSYCLIERYHAPGEEWLPSQPTL